MHLLLRISQSYIFKIDKEISVELAIPPFPERLATGLWSIVACVVNLFLDVHQSIEKLKSFEVNCVGFIASIFILVKSMDLSLFIEHRRH